ncbi:MAG: hypothetical protein RJB66_2570 [Pseudomonadota bacterium]|jgi:1-aminocyclopropane-1-carboxylate deaminase/D-cysteine desulfhydrase-like pyridoxal-dependent ACC family enzyme
MRSVPLFSLRPDLEKNWVPLIREVTPAYPLSGFSKLIGANQISVKREDLTDALYGGNKVRNLEFLLGDALAKKAKRVVGLAPLGSNFIAALSAQSSKIQMPVSVYHFVPTCTQQMRKHAEFSARVGANLKTYKGGYIPSLLQASAQFSFEILSQGTRSYRMPTGGSSYLGALGHFNAFLELQEQIAKGEIPGPDFLIVGAGTCGTMAGLLAAQVLTQSKIQIIGVRCVDRVICNRWSIARLANQVLEFMGSQERIEPLGIDLRDRGMVAYGSPDSDANHVLEAMMTSEGLLLDTTYTTKVVSYLSHLVQQPDYKEKKFLYWHTFSPAAMQNQLPELRSVPLMEPTLI